MRVTDGYNASLVSFSLGIAVATFTFIALAIILAKPIFFLSTMSINELLSIVKPGEEETEPLTDDQHTLKRPRKCPGCKVLHAEHSFGDPGPYCTGPDDTHLSDDGNPPPDEENEASSKSST